MLKLLKGIGIYLEKLLNKLLEQFLHIFMIEIWLNNLKEYTSRISSENFEQVSGWISEGIYGWILGIALKKEQVEFLIFQNNLRGVPKIVL